MMATVTPAVHQRAEQLAERIPLMARGHSKLDGCGFYVIPSSTKPQTVAYYSSDLGCTCPSFRHRGVCCHQQACLIVLQRQTAAMVAATVPAPKSAQQRYAEAGPFGPCCHKGCALAATGKNRRCDEHFQALLDTLGY